MERFEEGEGGVVMKSPVKIIRHKDFVLKFFDESELLTKSVESEKSYSNSYLNVGECKSTSKYGIEVFQNDVLLSSCIIGAEGGGTGIYENSFVITDDSIVICCSDSVFELSLPSLDLMWVTKVEWATCFEIFSIDSDFIVHGETTISRLDKTGKIRWQKGGADIFLTPEGENDFILTDSYIEVKDWDHRIYRFDFDGNSIL